MQAIIDACADDRLSAVPAVVVSNNRKAEAIERAKASQIPAFVLNSVTHSKPEDLDFAILDTLHLHDCDVVVLAGFMKKIGPQVLTAYSGRMLNVHPALLPKFGGQGMFGAHVHQAVLAAGEKVTGASVHLVDSEYDQGEVLAQMEVPVLEEDSVESLAARVLPKEHELLVQTLQGIVAGEIAIPNKVARDHYRQRF
jgi:phosphoribosylglycinamide formyltransferase-1